MAEFIIRDRVLTKYNGCKKVIHIPYGVTEIGQSAFMDHNEIESVTLPDSVTVIEANAFFGCDAMKSINIPQGVGKIDDNAFLCCESLRKIVIPDSVTELGMWCFSECKSLRTVWLPESIRNIGALAFNHTKWLDEYPEDFVTVNGILICYKGDDTTVEIPAGVKMASPAASAILWFTFRNSTLKQPRLIDCPCFTIFFFTDFSIPCSFNLLSIIPIVSFVA